MESEPGSLLKKWFVAVRPFAYTASVLPVLLGTVLAWYSGYPLLWGRFGLALLGVVCFHTAANLWNDGYDYQRGLDRKIFPGSGAVVRGWLTVAQVNRGALVFFVVGSICGLLLFWLAGWPVLLLGLLGGGLTFWYTRSGFCLKYAGFGDLSIFVSFGILPVFGAWWIQSQTFSWQPVLWSLPIVSFTVAILHANNWRDLQGDRQSSCRTMASMLGPGASRIYYRALIVGPFAVLFLYLIAAHYTAWPIEAPLTVLLTLLTLPLSLRLAFGDSSGESEAIAMLVTKTAQMHLLFSMLLTLGFVADMLLASAI